MNFKQFFSQKVASKLSRWSEFGGYTSSFYSFGNDLYKSEIVRACIRPLAEHTSKANPNCKSNKALERMLQFNPNEYMNGKDFLYKVRTQYELKNTAFVAIIRNETLKVTRLYPLSYSNYESLQDEYGNLYIKFTFSNGSTQTFSWNDLVVLRKDYNKSDIAGDDNRAILETLDLISTTNQGISNAVKSTSNLRGIIKVTKGQLKAEDVKKSQEAFTKDYMSINNEGGIAALDNTMEFTPIKMDPSVTTWTQMREFRENVYRYFGVNEKIITSNYSEEDFDALYESKIEPFLLALGLELTRKLFTPKQIAQGREIMFESNRMAYASNSTKLKMVALVDRGALTPNEWREIFNLGPVPGGDVPLLRLDTAPVIGDKQVDDKEEDNDNKE